MIDTSVKFFFGNPNKRIHTDAPKLTTNAGGWITILDACLVNGFGTRNVTSLTIDAFGIATVVTATDHGFQMPETRILISGADQTPLNGEWIIKDIINRNTLTFNASGIGLENSSATGTITIKVAPLGWTKEYSGTNIAVYRAKGGNRPYLYINDTSYNARVRGYRSMSDLQVGIDPFPNDSQFPGGGYWSHYVASQHYGNSNSGTDCVWHLVGDDRFFYLGGPVGCHQGCHSGGPSQLYRSCYFFGEFPSYIPGDINNVIIQHARCPISTSYWYRHDGLCQDEFYFGYSYDGKYILGKSDNLQNSQSRFMIYSPAGYLTNSQSANDSVASRFYGLSSRNPITGGSFFMAYPTTLYVENDGIRGHLPGLYFSIQENYWFSNSPIMFEDIIYTDSLGRKFFVLPHSNGHYEGTYYFIRIDKNWREI